ncbi:MAG: hypothetical protein ACI9XO_004624 [Paraglaciecola sp.]
MESLDFFASFFVKEKRSKKIKIEPIQPRDIGFEVLCG